MRTVDELRSVEPMDRADAEALFERVSRHAARRRRLRRIRLVAGSTLSAAFLAGALSWALLALRGLDSEDALPVADGVANYVALDVEVRPAVDPDTGELDPATAIVSYQLAWASGRYPGEHHCTAVVYDGQGAEVGRKRFQFASFQPVARSEIDMSVSGPPARGDLACDPKRDDTPVAYVISNVLIEAQTDGRLEVVYDVAWPEDVRLPEYPATNACVARIEGPLGWVREDRITLSVPPGTYSAFRDNGVDYEGDLADLVASVKCHPWSESDQATHNDSKKAA